ncbi:type II toxin-antitoxin system RelE/ParE family toxin [Cyanothece sp. BG0011]|uniref:type II toxin-antitoxin system RelE/ParE family toxin n=1 Tax=Cyanothece sp. BG0011 TaxID=2082950 RepID=UPI000D1D7CAB|nr:type II toxin-antitoxin system RelE/ParE family toxin [Cyanothece sp. BG0011]
MTICLISPQASRDLDDIFDYFAQVSVDAGERFVLEFEKKCNNLKQFPKMGRSYSEFQPSLRGVPLDNYIIFYRIIDNDIEIIRVLSAYRDLNSLLTED